MTNASKHLNTIIQTPTIESVNEWWDKTIDETTTMQTRVTLMNHNDNRLRATEIIKAKIENCLRCSQEKCQKCKCLKQKARWV